MFKNWHNSLNRISVFRVSLANCLQTIFRL